MSDRGRGGHECVSGVGAALLQQFGNEVATRLGRVEGRAGGVPPQVRQLVGLDQQPLERRPPLQHEPQPEVVERVVAHAARGQVPRGPERPVVGAGGLLVQALLEEEELPVGQRGQGLPQRSHLLLDRRLGDR